MGEGLQSRLFYSLEHLLAGWIIPQVGAHHERVNEQANNVFDFLAVAVSYGRPHVDPLLVGVAIEQNLQGTQQGHE